MALQPSTGGLTAASSQLLLRALLIAAVVIVLMAAATYVFGVREIADHDRDFVPDPAGLGLPF